MERLTISLDDDLGRSLANLQEHSGDSKANLIRRALRDYLRRHREGARPTEHDLKVWTDLLANHEHVILDVAHLRLLFGECMQAGDGFWQRLHEIGVEHGRQYKDKGLRSVRDVLNLISAANWWFVAPESDRSWSLVLTEPSSKPFVACFMRGLFESFPQKVEVIEESVKIRVRVIEPPPPTPAAAARSNR